MGGVSFEFRVSGFGFRVSGFLGRLGRSKLETQNAKLGTSLDVLPPGQPVTFEECRFVRNFNADEVAVNRAAKGSKRVTAPVPVIVKPKANETRVIGGSVNGPYLCVHPGFIRTPASEASARLVGTAPGDVDGRLRHTGSNAALPHERLISGR